MTWFFQNHKWKIRHNPKPQASSSKPHAPVFRSRKLQASSLKQAINETVPWNEIAEAHAQPEVASDKPQASSTKRR
jgi:hypothetical protein